MSYFLDIAVAAPSRVTGQNPSANETALSMDVEVGQNEVLLGLHKENFDYLSSEPRDLDPEVAKVLENLSDDSVKDPDFCINNFKSAIVRKVPIVFF